MNVSHVICSCKLFTTFICCNNYEIQVVAYSALRLLGESHFDCIFSKKDSDEQQETMIQLSLQTIQNLKRYK